mgnify:CR=1 FL=1
MHIILMLLGVIIGMTLSKERRQYFQIKATHSEINKAAALMMIKQQAL